MLTLQLGISAADALPVLGADSVCKGQLLAVDIGPSLVTITATLVPPRLCKANVGCRATLAQFLVVVGRESGK